MKYLRAIVFYSLYTLLTLGISVAVLLVRVLGRDTAWRVGRYWGRLGNMLLRLIYGIRVRVEGREHIPDQPCVIVANHQSTWETTTFPVVLPPFVWILKKELMYIPFFGWALYALGVIAIDRANARAALKQVNDQGGATAIGA